MPARNIRRTIVLTKIEPSTYGQDSLPTAANALQVSNVSIKPFNANTVERDVVSGKFGSSGVLQGSRYVEVSFELPAVGAGSAGDAPSYASTLMVCGLAGTESANVRYDITTVTDGIAALTLYYYDDGLLHSVRGCRGKISLSMKGGEKPKFMVTLLGLYTLPVPASNLNVNVISGNASLPAPQVVTSANTGSLIIGGTLNSSGAPAITGGTPYHGDGFEIDLGNSVEYFDLLGGIEQVEFMQRNVTGKITLDLNAYSEQLFYGYVESGTMQSLGMSHGTVVGNKFLSFMPAVQFYNPSKTEKKGKRMLQLDFAATNTGAGNDDIRFVTSF